MTLDPAPLTDFGFAEIPTDEKTRRVAALFDGVAHNYDVMNDLLSLGLHRVWKRRFTAALPLFPGMRLLDLAGGTGDVAAEISARMPSADIILADLTPAMLTEGRRRLFERAAAVPGNISFCGADAQRLPFPDKSFDGVTMAFGIRNVADKEAALREVRRVLKTGGFFACLEFTRPPEGAFGALYRAWSFKAMPFLGKVVAKDEDAYRYLAESIARFPDAERFAAMIRAAGLSGVSVKSMQNGVAAFHMARRV